MLLGVGGQLTACKLEQFSSPYWDLSVLKYDGTRVGTDDGSWPFCPFNVSGARFLPS